MLSEEIANQRMYKHDDSQDTAEKMQARMDLLDKRKNLTQKQVDQMEAYNKEAEEKVRKQAFQHYVVVMVVKVLIGNCMMLWLTSSFYAVTMDYTGREAKIKVIVGMVCSSIQAVTRCKINSSKLGGL